MIEIKRDIDSYVVYVNGKVHPKGTGFESFRHAHNWVNIALFPEKREMKRLEIENLFEHLFDELDGMDEQDDIWIDRNFEWGRCSDLEPNIDLIYPNVFYLFPYEREHEDLRNNVVNSYIDWVNKQAQ